MMLMQERHTLITGVLFYLSTKGVYGSQELANSLWEIQNLAEEEARR